MTNFKKLIPEMRGWTNGANVDAATWVGVAGSVELAIGYSTLFWPEFVEFERYVLRAGFPIESLRSFESACNGDQKRIEAVMNHLHVADIHRVVETTTREQIIYLGRILRDIYRVKLAWQFPNKFFEVYFDDSNFDVLTDYEITFVQTDASK